MPLTTKEAPMKRPAHYNHGQDNHRATYECNAPETTARMIPMILNEAGCTVLFSALLMTETALALAEAKPLRTEEAEAMTEETEALEAARAS